MGIEGKGFGRADELRKLLPQLETHLQTLSEVEPGEVDTSGSKRDIRAQMQSLDAQIDVIRGFARSSNPEVQQATKVLVDKLQTDRLSLEDPILAMQIATLRQDFAPQLQAIAVGKAPDKHLSNVRLDTILALVGDEVSGAEAHALNLIKPLMTPEQQAQAYKPLMQASYEAELASGRGMQKFKVMGAAAFPLVPIATATALSLSEAVSGPLGYFISLGIIQVGTEAGKHLLSNAMDSAKDFGVNRFSHKQVDEALSRLVDRAGNTPLKGDAAQLTQTARVEAALIRQMIKSYEQNSPQSTGEVKTAIRALERYADALEHLHATEGKDPTEAQAARTALIQDVNVKALRQDAVTLQPAQQHSPEQVISALDRIVFESNKTMLGTTNGSLLRLTEQLESKYGIQGRLDAFRAGETPAEAKLDAGERSTLSLLVGETPSLAEFVAVARLDHAGLVDIESLFGEGIDIQLPDGGRMDSAALRSALHELSGRASGQSMQNLAAKMPIISKLLSFGVAVGLTLGGADLPTVIGSMIGTQLAGWGAGALLSKQGEKSKVLAGVDAAQGKPLHNEYAILMERMNNPGELLKGDAKTVKASLLAEAATIKTLAGSAGAAIERAQNIALSKRHYQFLSFVYEQLDGFANALEQTAQQHQDVNSLREGFVQARAQHITPDVGYNILMDGLIGDTVSEAPVQLGLYVATKLELLDALQQITERETTAPKNGVILRQARTLASMKNGLPKDLKKKVEEDEIDRFAANVAKDVYGTLDLKTAAKLAAGKAEHKARLETEYFKLAPISDDRAQEIGQEVLNGLWTQIFPLLGIVDRDESSERPRLTKVNVETIQGEGEKVPQFKVTGELKQGRLFGSGSEGAQFELMVDYTGQPKIDGSFKLDLGSRFLGQLAERTIVRHLEALGLPTKGSIKSTAIDPATLGSEAKHAFEVRVGSQRFQLAMHEEGLPVLDSIRKV